MKKYRCALARMALLTAGLVAAAASYSQPLNDGDLVGQRLESAVNWLNAATSSTAGSGSRRISSVVLPMSVPNYQQFVAAAYGENVSGDLGKPALSAYFQAKARLGKQDSDTCFMLYNESTKNEIESQFVAPHRKAYGESIIPYAFVTAHELGHCIEFQHNSTDRNQSRSKLQLEVSADVFAILLLKKTGIDNDELTAITKSRINKSASHSTWKWIQPAFSETFNFKNESLIEDLWKTADKISEQAP